MAARVTQSVVEVLRLAAAPPPVRGTQAVAEVLRTTAYPGQRVSQAAAEVLVGTRATAAVTQAVVEVLKRPGLPAGALVAQAAAEVLVRSPFPALVTQAVAEVLRLADYPPVRTTQAVAEVLVRRPRPVLVTQAVAEVLVAARPTPPPPPPPFAPPPPPAGLTDLPPLVNLDPTWEPRLRRFLALVSEAFNSLVRKGYLTRAGVGDWAIGQPAGPTGTFAAGSFGAGAAPAGEFLASVSLANGLLAGGTFKPLSAADIPDLSGAYQPLDPDLTAIAALAGTDAIYYRHAAGDWQAVTIGTNLTFSGGTLSAAGGGGGSGTVTSVNLTAPAAGITASGGPVTTSGSITLALANDLAALEALSGTNTIYYRSGADTWSAVTIGTNLTFSGGTLSASGSGSDPISAVYPVFTPAGVDDEFSGGSFSGWTLVDDGTHQATVTQANNVCSVALPGGDTAGHLHAWLKTATVSVGDIIETVIRGAGPSANFHMAGLIMADGTTYGSGAQVCWAVVPVGNTLQLFAHSNFNTQGTDNTVAISGTTPRGDLFLRLVYVAANTFAGYVSADGVSWINLTGSLTRTVSPAAVGFFATTFGATSPFNWSFRYFRKHT